MKTMFSSYLNIGINGRYLLAIFPLRKLKELPKFNEVK